MRAFARVLWRVLVLAVVVVVAVVGVTLAWVVLTAGQDERRPADAIVVLGAAQYDGQPAPYLRARLEHARELYAEGVSPRILTVGGSQEGDRFTEAQAGDQFLIDEGVPPQAVLPIGEGSDTLESAHAVARVMRERGWESTVVVTDPWHTLRATTMLEDHGVPAHGSPTRTGPSLSSTEVKVRYALRETAALLYYYWTHWGR